MTLVFVSIVALVSWCIGRISTLYVRCTPVERLKNALLSFALSVACKNDISDDMMYGNYDGTKLPRMAGASVANACFTYILDIAEFRRTPLYTQVMEAKILAIQKYIDANLDTEQKVLDFFEKFVSEIRT